MDALRGLAGLWVALSHYLPHWDDRGGRALILVPHAWGVYAVELFFVISGFVIFMTLEKCRGVLDFAVLRFSRLFPAYWATLAFSAAAGYLLFGQSVWPAGLLANATMLQEFLGYPHFDNVYWSLTAELAFYFHAAWLFGLGWHRRPKRLALVWLLLATAWALWLRVPGAEGRGRLALCFDFDYAPFFCMGILFFDALRNGWRMPGAALIGFAILVEGLIAGLPGLAVAAAIAVLFLAALSGRLDPIAKRPLLALGAISYSFYLVHRNLGYLSLDWMRARGVPAAVAVPLVLCGAVALASAFCFGVERPALAILRTRRQAARAPRPGGSPLRGSGSGDGGNRPG